MNPKFDTYVAVFIENADATTVKYVTGVDRNTAEWGAGRPAMPFAESYARDIVFGLTLNGFAAAVVKVLHGVELKNA